MSAAITSAQVRETAWAIIDKLVDPARKLIFCDRKRVEGLYCDPQSSPYQGLRLERRRDGWVWPAQEFR